MGQGGTGHEAGRLTDTRKGPHPGEPGCGPFVACSYRKELISIVSVRPGPTPIAEIGAPDISSRAFT